jgi:hypothetical protein
MLTPRDSRVWWTKFEHDPRLRVRRQRHAHVHDVVVPIRALDRNADQGVIKQANLIPTPEEAFSLRQLLIAAANPRGSSPTLDAFPTKDAEHETAPECRQPTAATVDGFFRRPSVRQPWGGAAFARTETVGRCRGARGVSGEAKK